nr:MAG TPA: Protein of unknown function (DUF2591) [Caudoviricetes sp.]
MKNYEDMSDFEINCQVAHMLGLSEHLFFPSGVDDFDSDTDEQDMGPVWQTSMIWVKGFRASNGNLFNPCNNPEDAEPIIIENRIGTIPAPDDGLWKAAHRKVGNDDTPYHFTQDKNPLRAAMIVFLKMNEDKL